VLNIISCLKEKITRDKHDRSTIEEHQLTSAARYSRTAARYTGAPDPTRCA
jgi:hypothetical protein